MNVSTHSALVLDDKWPRALVTHTTLYDLIAAINAVVGAEEDDLVIACVVHLLKTQRLTYLGASAPRRLVTAHRLAPPRRRKAGTTGRRRRSTPNALRTPSSLPWAPPRSMASICRRRPPANA